MCLETSVFPIKRVAKEDIIVYKTLFKDELKSVYTGYIYKLGELNPEIKIKPVGGFLRKKEIDDGYHSFVLKDDAYKNAQYTRSKSVFECVIPKGSTYYKGKNNGDTPGIVSSNLIVKKEL